MNDSIKKKYKIEECDHRKFYILKKGWFGCWNYVQWKNLPAKAEFPSLESAKDYLENSILNPKKKEKKYHYLTELE